MAQFLTGCGDKCICLRADVRNENTSWNNRRRAAITVLHRHRPKHCTIRLIDSVKCSTASGTTYKHSSIRGSWRRGKSVLTWETNTPEQSSAGGIKSLQQSVKVYNEDFSGIIRGVRKEVSPTNSPRPHCRSGMFIERHECGAVIVHCRSRDEHQTSCDQRI